MLLSLAVLSTAACSHVLPTRLPSKRPADLVVTESSSGGMLPSGDSTRISAKGCHYERHNGPAKLETDFTLKPAELDQLYSTLRDNAFDRIQTRHEEVYDRGGVSVSVSWSGHRYWVANSGTDFIRKDWKKQWHAVLAAIHAPTERALAAKNVSATFAFDPALAGHRLVLRVGSRAVVRRRIAPPSGGDDFAIPVRDLPGPYMLHVAIDQARPYDGTVEVKSGATFRFVVRDNAVALDEK